MVGATEHGRAAGDPLPPGRARTASRPRAPTSRVFVGAHLDGGASRVCWPPACSRRDPLVLAALLAPGYYGGMVAGTRLFARFDDRRFRQLHAARCCAAVSLGILLA